MEIFLDILINFSIVIIFILIEISCLKNNNKLLNYACCQMSIVLIFMFPFLLAKGYGNRFFAIVTQFIFLCVFSIMLFKGILNDIENKMEVNIRKCIVNFSLMSYTFVGIFSIYFRTKLEEEFSGNLIDKANSSSFTKMFLVIIENEWFKGISIGLINTVFGGVILNKIIGRKNKDKSDKNN